MFTRRTLLKRGGYAALATAAPMLIRTARAQTTSFNFYIGPNGSDSNPGTQASPWAITSLNNKWTAYAGKSVGILPGTYNVYALVQAGAGFNRPALVVNGGTSGSPTLIQSTTPRGAILTAANPSGGGYPTNNCGMIGQGQYSSAPPNLGNVIIDGLYFTRGFQVALNFYLAQSGSGEGGPTGLEIRNCEVFDISGVLDNNVSAIYLQGYTGAWVHNNKLHSVQPGGGGNADDCAGIYSYYCHSNIYEYNTIYDCNNAIFDKASPNGNHTWRYNYLESNGLTPQNCVHGGSGGQLSDKLTIHNNIMLAPQSGLWDGSGGAVGVNVAYQSLLLYNNTCLFAAGDSGVYFPAGGSTVSPPANVTQYNNVFSYTSTGFQGAWCYPSPSLVASDYNLVGTYAASSTALGMSTQGNLGTPTLYTLASWRTVFGLDAHSAALNPSFLSPTYTASSLNPLGWALQSGTAGSASSSSPGSVGGVTGGALCDMGAWGGASPPTQIGCNFGPAGAVPNPPVIISVS
jgi:hypothetical protein